MNQLEMIAALKKLGYDEDELNGLSASDLSSMYNQKIKAMPVQNNDQTPSLEQMKKKRKPLTQQEKNAAMADYSFASPDFKGAVFNPQNEEQRDALIDSNAADMQKGTGFAYTKEALKPTSPEYGEKPYGDASEIVSNNPEKATAASNTSYNPQQFESGATSCAGRYRPMGILDAWRAGCFGDKNSDEAKSSRNYLLADQVGTFMRNLGKSVGNVGAQYSGGAIDNNRETDNWSSIQNKMADPTWQAKQEALERDNITRAYNNNMLKLRGNMANEIQKYIQNAPNDTIRLKYMDIANKMLSGQSVSDQDLAIAGAGEIYQMIKEALGF